MGSNGKNDTKYFMTAENREKRAKKETKEMYYKMAVKLLDLMLKNGFITTEEYKKIDSLNRNTFSPELSKVYV